MPSESNGTIRALCGFRQTRQLLDRAVPEAALHEILDVGRWSGRSRNSQPWHSVAVRDRETLRLAELVSDERFGHRRG